MPPPPQQTEGTIAGQNEVYNREDLAGPLLVHTLLGLPPPPPLQPPPSPSSSTSLGAGASCRSLSGLAPGIPVTFDMLGNQACDPAHQTDMWRYPDESSQGASLAADGGTHALSDSCPASNASTGCCWTVTSPLTSSFMAFAGAATTNAVSSSPSPSPSPASGSRPTQCLMLGGGGRRGGGGVFEGGQGGYPTPPYEFRCVKFPCGFR